MTGMIVHDLKNPLNAIINYSQDKNDLTQVIINQAGKQMHNLVMNILDVQKFEDARMHLEEEDQNLSQLTRNAIDQVELLSREKDLEIINNCASDITVAVDPGIIERVFINLLTNAIKFSPLNGKITIDAADCPVDLIAVAVTDQGKGIPPDKIDSVFDRFEQVSPQKAGKIRSTGLGLTFCKLAIESHGGTIGVESVIGEHTTFWFTLKKSDKASASREPEKEAQRARLNLTEEQRKQLVSTIGQFESIEIYEISALRKILRDISFEDDDELNRWKELVRRAIYSGNEERYRELINI
jgi:signal transduction histidine kinase